MTPYLPLIFNLAGLVCGFGLGVIWKARQPLRGRVEVALEVVDPDAVLSRVSGIRVQISPHDGPTTTTHLPPATGIWRLTASAQVELLGLGNTHDSAGIIARRLPVSE